MTASTPRKESGAPPQRIFINAGKVVDRPPTLFRMPTVKKPSAAVEPAAPPAAAPSAPQALAGQQQPSELASSHASAPAPQVHSAQVHSAQVHSAQAHSAHRSDASTGSPAPRADQPAEPRLEKTAKSAAPIAPVPMPAERTWSETLGSRLILLLLIAAIAAVAFLANRSGGGPENPGATFTGLSLEKDGKGAAAADSASTPTVANPKPTSPADPLSPLPLKDRSSGQAVAVSSGPESQTRTPNTAAREGAADSPAAIGSAAKAGTPSFDLADLHGAGPQSPGAATASSDQPARSAEETDNASVPRSREFISEGISDEEAILAAVDAAVTAAGGAGAGADGTGADGAGAGSPPAYATTDQPAGVPDWLQYLPVDEPAASPSPDAASSLGLQSRASTEDGSAPADFTTADFTSGGREDRGFGAGTPEARTAANRYSGTAPSRWDGGYGAASADSAPPAYGSQPGYPSGGAQQDRIPQGDSQFGTPQHANPYHQPQSR